MGCPKRILPDSYCRSFGKKQRSRRSKSKGRGPKGSARKRTKCLPAKRNTKSKRSIRKGRSKIKRCARPGPMTKNPFLNFLRVFRKRHCNWPITKIAVEGAKCWCSMSKMNKGRFYREACALQKKNRKSKRKKCRPKSRKPKKLKSSSKSSRCLPKKKRKKPLKKRFGIC